MARLALNKSLEKDRDQERRGRTDSSRGAVFFPTVFSGLFSLSGSPSSGRDGAVFVLDLNQASFPLLFIPFLCLFLSLWTIELYFSP